VDGDAPSDTGRATRVSLGANGSLGASYTRPRRRLVRDPLEEFTRLDVERDTEPIERVSRETAKGYLGIGKAVGCWHSEPGLTRQPVRRPTFALEHVGEMKPNHKTVVRVRLIIP